MRPSCMRVNITTKGLKAITIIIVQSRRKNLSTISGKLSVTGAAMRICTQILKMRLIRKLS